MAARHLRSLEPQTRPAYCLWNAAQQRGLNCSVWAGQQHEESGGGSGWMPGFLKSRLPSVLGGSKDTDEMENLTLDTFATSLKRARQLGGLTGFAYGTTAANDPAAKGTMRMFEQIIGAMTPEEKTDLSLFNSAARQRVAAEVGCTTSQVDDCTARFLWMKSMTAKMAALKKQGKEMPKTVDEVERMCGTWRQHKTELSSSREGGGGENLVPLSAKGPKGEPCPLAGGAAGKNTKCPLTRKAFKACCGKRLGMKL